MTYRRKHPLRQNRGPGLEPWFSTSGPWTPGSPQTMSKRSEKDDCDPSKVCECPNLSFKVFHTSIQHFFRHLQMKKTLKAIGLETTVIGLDTQLDEKLFLEVSYKWIACTGKAYQVDFLRGLR